MFMEKEIEPPSSSLSFSFLFFIFFFIYLFFMPFWIFVSFWSNEQQLSSMEGWTSCSHHVGEPPWGIAGAWVLERQSLSHVVLRRRISPPPIRRHREGRQSLPILSRTEGESSSLSSCQAPMMSLLFLWWKWKGNGTSPIKMEGTPEGSPRYKGRSSERAPSSSSLGEAQAYLIGQQVEHRLDVT